jgi:5-methylcytosine-specific restriction endonuclease McrA
MAWSAKSNRIVPTDWHRRKAAVHRRDQGVCHVCGHGGADEVDHIRNVAAGGSHELTNLALIHGKQCSVCGKRCHIQKTAAEASAHRVRRARPTERHPGLL